MIPFLLLGSCSKEENTSVGKNQGVIVLNRQSKSTLLVGDTYQIEGELQNDSDDVLAYQSLTKEVLSVSENGLVTALKKGTGRIRVYAKMNPDTATVLSFTVYERIQDAFPSLGRFLSTFEDVDKESGYDFDLSFLLDMGKIKADVFSLIETTVLDLTYNPDSQSDRRLKLDMDIFHQKKDRDFYQASVYLENAFSELLKKNTILNTIFKNLNLRGSIYSRLLSQCTSYGSYLNEDDYSLLNTMNLYSYGMSDIYSTLERKDSDKLVPFAFGKGNLVSLLSPYIDEFLSSLKGSDFQSDIRISDSSAILGMLSNYLVEKKNTGSVTYSLNENAVGLIDQKYQEILPEKEKEADMNGIKMKFSLPEKITGAYLKIDDTYYDSQSKARFVLEGKRYSKNETYPFMEIDVGKPVQSDKAQSKDKTDRFESYLQASNPSISLDGTETVTPRELIMEAEEIRTAEKEYQASGDRFQAKKDELLGYYFNNAESQEKKDLLYPMYERLRTLNYSTQDYSFAYCQKTDIQDKESIPFSLTHLYHGENINDFTSSYQSDDEEIIKVNAFGQVSPVQGIYDGNVSDSNEKTADTQANVTATMNPNGQESFQNAKTFQKTFTYKGLQRGFRKTQTAFKENENFDEKTRELTLMENSTFSLKSLLDLPVGLTAVSFRSSDDRLVSTSALTLSDKAEIHSAYENSKKIKRDLCGIKATVLYMEDMTPKQETLVFYIRIRKS